ncbi:MAG: hypothetical protein DRN04_19485 [Thermoprotei archaeon]|nr:MAG: hypothetical protein DRN04_19485 [Thermoprotei archaeon]
MYIVDASVFASIIVKDKFYNSAKELIVKYRREGLITVDIVFVELANAPWKHTFKPKRIPEKMFNELKTSYYHLYRTQYRKFIAQKT